MDKILEMKPLTLEELQKMNGQPVFVITKDGKKILGACKHEFCLCRQY